ncbi:MAG: undecaprenyl/decaprenyl-phosphate alpha-N-acetylglucosaminyl 1-phosphate transferase [Clostridiales bacterium]|nr:undecaprenyl/decaprenyl-phosphate alpha-N-acetylglucosaminyl 1-phosphate transferase [Clostridiales bacterium]
MIPLVFISFLVAFVITLVLTPLAIKIAPKIGAMDVPKDDRRMHTESMPRFGGIAIFIGSMAAMFFILPIEVTSGVKGIAIGATIILIMGIVDDIWSLSAKIKLAIQILCACILFASSVRISFISDPFGDGYIYFPWFVSLVVTVIWIVGITNTINLIDGLDGLAAGVSFIATVCIAYIAYIHGRYEIAMAFMALAGSCLGFLPWNFHPAKIFMGDGGSLYLGFMIASISVLSPMKSATVIATVLPIFVLAIPIFDTIFAIFRRIKNGRPIMEADNEHLHHLIMTIGMGQKRSVLTLYGISGVMGVAAILISRDLFVDAIMLIIIAATLIYVFMKDQGFGKPLNGDRK